MICTICVDCLHTFPIMIIIGVTYAAYGIIFKAMARLRQKPAPPVANQNNVFCYKEIVFVVDNLTMQDIIRQVQRKKSEMTKQIKQLDQHGGTCLGGIGRWVVTMVTKDRTHLDMDTFTFHTEVLQIVLQIFFFIIKPHPFIECSSL